MALQTRFMRPLARFQSQAAFSPLAISGLKLWLDAATSSSMTLNSGNVSEWSDLSPEGNDATQATALNQPEYVANSVNGLGSVVFDGSSDTLSVTVPGISTAGTHCVAWVFSRLGNGSDNDYSPTIGILQQNADQGALHYVKGNLSGASYPYYSENAASGTFYDGNGSYSVDSVEVMLFSLADGAYSVLKNGTEEGNGTLPELPGTNALGFALAHQPSPPRYANVRLCEVVAVFNQSSTDERKLEGYLAHRWGLESKLPSVHPYKDAAP